MLRAPPLAPPPQHAHSYLLSHPDTPYSHSPPPPTGTPTATSPPTPPAFLPAPPLQVITMVGSSKISNTAASSASTSTSTLGNRSIARLPSSIKVPTLLVDRGQSNSEYSLNVGIAWGAWCIGVVGGGLRRGSVGPEKVTGVGISL